MPMTISRSVIRLSTLILFTGLLSACWQSREQESDPAKIGNTVVATVEGRSITLRQIEHTAALPLYQIDQQRNQLLQRALQQMIDEELLATEASHKGLSVSQLFDMASKSESIARLANLPAPVKRLGLASPPNNPDQDTAQGLQEQARVRQALLVSLRRKADIRITLPTPEPPILLVSSKNNPQLGPDNAPITIVEFSDFQCPYCQKSVAVLKELRRQYGDKIRMVYRDYPGPNHPFAQGAAEAAHCAGEQGKFWEYHDALFADQSSSTGWDFAAVAQEVKLEPAPFSECLTTGRYRESIKRDQQEGVALGIASTPTFFINGRPLVGARSMADFTALIDPLLRN